MIKSAAIKKDDEIFTGSSHSAIMNNEIINGVVLKDYPQGFVNDKNEFLTRSEAMIEAKKCNQISIEYSDCSVLQSYMIKKW